MIYQEKQQDEQRSKPKWKLSQNQKLWYQTGVVFLSEATGDSEALVALESFVMIASPVKQISHDNMSRSV